MGVERVLHVGGGLLRRGAIGGGLRRRALAGGLRRGKE